MPQVSFVIPTLNSAATLESCLKSISEQNYANKEIIIVDGGSRDRTLAIASKYATRIISRKGPLGLARGVGCEVACGDVLGIFDSDTALPHTNWLQAAVVHFCSNQRLAILWPRNVAPPNASLVTRAYFHLWEAFQQEREKEDVLPGGNSLVLKRSFEEVGGFNPTIQWGEDFDLARRIVAKGFEVITHDDPIFHDSMRTLHEFTSKQIRAASFLSKVHSRNRVLGRQLIMQSMSWSAGRSNDHLVRLALEHVMIGIKWSVRKSSQTNDRSWLLIPLLMAIRVFAYLPYYVKTMIRVRSD